MNTWQLGGVNGKEQDQTAQGRYQREGVSAHRQRGPKNPFEAIGSELSGTILYLEIYNAIKRKTKETELKCVVLFHSPNGFFFIFS